jgi:membrane peptidoglycan carboxypeptidase
VCGKTGTTASMKDRWFCGYTNYYTAAVWCGYDLPEVIKLTGIDQSNPAGRLWKKVMEPLHRGLNSVPMYDADKFVSVDVCLDCGKLATSSCNKDPRVADNGGSRVDYNVMVYQEDIPLEKCDCHVEVEWCEDCNAVANEYCKKLASVGRATISKRCLVKMTVSKFNEIVEVSDKGLYPQHCQDNYIWLVDRDGNDVSFKGIDGKANKGVDAPYLVCNEHTKKMWQQYVDKHPEHNAPDANMTDPTETVTEEGEEDDLVIG